MVTRRLTDCGSAVPEGGILGSRRTCDSPIVLQRESSNGCITCVRVRSGLAGAGTGTIGPLCRSFLRAALASWGCQQTVADRAGTALTERGRQRDHVGGGGEEEGPDCESEVAALVPLPPS